MKDDYLSWYKDLLPEIQGREDIIPLVSSRSGGKTPN